MARFEKTTRDIPNIEDEIAKVSNNKETKKEVKKEKNKKDNKKKDNNKKVKESYFAGVKKEVSKVVWPDKKKLVKYSIASITFIIFFAVFFYVIELIMALLEAGV